MADRERYLTDADVRYQKGVNKRVRGGSGSKKPPGKRRRGPAPFSGRVIYAQVNEPAGVTDSDTTFSFDNAIKVVGNPPPDGTGTAQNQYAQTYADNEWVLLFYDYSQNQWLTERGGTAGSAIIYFELTEDKAYADAAKLAKPVTAAGALDTGADAFYVVDDQRQFYGKAASGGGEGYRGFAWKYTDDYTGGVPGYRIITMEQPADKLVVSLSGAYGGAGGTTCTYHAKDIHGFPFNNRKLPDTSGLTVYDDFVVATDAQNGDKWFAVWNKTDARYTFLTPLTIRKEQFGLLVADMPAAVPNYDATTSFIQHGFALAAVIPMERAALAGASGEDELQGATAAKMAAVNPFYTQQIKAGIGTNEDKPVIVRGHQEHWSVYSAGSVTEMDVFVITNVHYPVTIVKGQATAAVSGTGNFTIDNLTVLWGRDPGVASLSVANPEGWDADDNAYCLAMQLTDGTWQAIDLACPAS